MKFIRSKRGASTYLFCIVLLVSSCSLPQEELPKEPDLTKEYIRQWNETLEAERIEPSGSWILFSPEANMDSLMKAWYGDTIVVGK